MVGKGEIAHYEQFLLLPQCFQKACFPGASKGVIVWEWVNAFLPYLDFQHFSKQPVLDCSKLKEFAHDNLKFDENGRKFSKRVEKEKLLFTINNICLPTVFSNYLYCRHIQTRACLGKG